MGMSLEELNKVVLAPFNSSVSLTISLTILIRII